LEDAHIAICIGSISLYHSPQSMLSLLTRCLESWYLPRRFLAMKNT